MTLIAFGATVQLTVGKSNGAEFRRQIQEHIDQSTAQGGGVRLKNITIALDQQRQTEMRERLQGYFNNTQVTIKVAKIDAAAAISELKQRIRTGVMGLTAISSGAGAATQTPGVATANKELTMLARNADNIYRRASTLGGGQADNIVRQYRELSAEIQRARTLEGDALTEATAGIQKKIAALRSEMEAITSLDKVERQRAGTFKQISQLEGKLDRNLAKALPGQSRSVGDELTGLRVDAFVASTNDELGVMPPWLVRGRFKVEGNGPGPGEIFAQRVNACNDVIHKVSSTAGGAAAPPASFKISSAVQ